MEKEGLSLVLHYDGAGVHAFLMQVYGRKQFIIFSPDQEPFLYPSPEKENLSLLNSVDKPDLTRFPLFAKVVPTTFTLEPGELLFIPSHWWHTTKMFTPSISISANVINESNWHELVHFVCMRRSIKTRIPARAYLSCAGAWRAAKDRRHPHPSLPVGRRLRSSLTERSVGPNQFLGRCLISLCGGLQSVLEIFG